MQGSRSDFATEQELGGSVIRAYSNELVEAASSPAWSIIFSELALGRLIHDGAFVQRPDVGQSRSVALVLKLRVEAIRVAVLTALCATASNSLRHEPDIRAARALTRFYPVGSSDFILASSRYRRLEPGSDVAFVLDAFNNALGVAMVASMWFTASRQTTPNLSDIATAELCEAWQVACTKACSLLIELDNAIGVPKPIGQTYDGDALITALKQAASGGTPLRDPDGGFTMPSWVDQRSTPRVPVDCGASLIDGAGTSEVRITDISTGGLGIETSFDLGEDNIVTIKVNDIVLPGRVKWCKRGRAGIAFEQSLLDDSPEYHFLAKHAETP
jgi:hypothetical protein